MKIQTRARKIRKWVVMESVKEEENFSGSHLIFGPTIRNIVIYRLWSLQNSEVIKKLKKYKSYVQLVI